MAVKVHLKNLHISARKVRLVAGLIRGKDVTEAVRQLRFADKGAARPVLKLLNSGVATATHDFEMMADNLRVAEVLVNEGPTMKRWRARAHGRAFPIMKRSAHVTIVLEEKIKGKKAKGKKKDTSTKKIATKTLTPEKKAEESKTDKDSKPPTGKGPRAEGQSVKKGKDASQAGLLNKMFRRKSV